MTDRELMQQALDALTRIWEDGLENYPVWAHEAAIDNLRERLAQPEQEPATKAGELRAMKDEFWKQPEQEPVATLDDLEQEIYENTRQFVSRDVMEWMLKRYYTTPPQRKPLTPHSPCEMTQAEGKMFKLGWLECEAAHGIKGQA